MPFARLGYPTAVASEGNPAVPGKLMGDLNPHLHTVNDTMHVDDKSGKYSIEVSKASLDLSCRQQRLTYRSTWRAFPSLQLRLLLNRLGGTTHGDRQ